MPRPLIIVLLIAAAPASAAAPSYRATLAASAAAVAVVRDLRWQCAGAICTAPFTATSSAATVCASVVRKLGAVTAFAAGAHMFTRDEPDRCNTARH